MPDFVNVDTDYPQPGWEDALGFILSSVNAERPDFLLVAGDLVMGRWHGEPDWPGEAGIRHFAARYYPAWIARMRAHGLPCFTAIGDHELGDNPWRGEKARLVPAYKAAFRRYLKMPTNGPPQMQGTAFWVRHRDALLIAVDVFEPGKSDQGEIRPGVTGEQLQWLDHVLEANAEARHVIVMGHTPVLGPVRQWSSSGLMLDGGRESAFWKTLARRGVDLYLCGEVHAITCTERDGVQQVAHGGLIGYNTRTNYLVVDVYPNRLELTLKEIDMAPAGEHLWQPGTNRPLERVTIPEAARRRGFQPVGALTIDKSDGRRRFLGRTGYFLKRFETSTERAGPVFRGGPPLARLPGSS